MVVLSRISPIQFAPNVGCLLPENNHCSVFDTGMFRALRMSSFKPVAINAACSSSFVFESAFMGATLAIPKTKATCVSSEVVTRARRKATAQKKLLLSFHRTCVTEPNQVVRRSSCALYSFFLEMANQSARQEILS